MNNIRTKLISKIKEDTGFEINPKSKFQRPSLTWAHKSAGRMSWYFYTDKGFIIGSSENMKQLLKSDKIQVYKGNFGFVDFSSS